MTETPAHPKDVVTRYIYSHKMYNTKGVKHNAFTPPKPYPNEISVDKINDPQLEENEIWELGQTARKDKSIVARADIKVSDIIALSNDNEGIKLNVFMDGIPHRRHGNIKSIPTLASLRRATTAALAKNSQLVIFEAE